MLPNFSDREKKSTAELPLVFKENMSTNQPLEDHDLAAIWVSASQSSLTLTRTFSEAERSSQNRSQRSKTEFKTLRAKRKSSTFLSLLSHIRRTTDHPVVWLPTRSLLQQITNVMLKRSLTFLISAAPAPQKSGI